MTQSLPENLIPQLKKCLALARELKTHPEANQAFEELRDRIAAENPQSAELLELMWNDLISARRSCSFLQKMSDVERQVSDRMMENMADLRRNYLRLIEEQ